jgi:hypothetical protein
MKTSVENAVQKGLGSRAFFVRYTIRGQTKVELWKAPQQGRGSPTAESVLTNFHNYIQKDRQLPPDGYSVVSLTAEYPDITDQVVVAKYDLPGGGQPAGWRAAA